jgi:hypothetical protein
MKNSEKTNTRSQSVDKEHDNKRISPLGHLFRFIGWWFGFADLYAIFAVCPFYGQQDVRLSWHQKEQLVRFFLSAFRTGNDFSNK